MSQARNHEVTLTANAITLRNPISYELDVDMLEDSDGFRLEYHLTGEVVQALKGDSEVRISIDGIPVMVGYVEGRAESGSGTVTVTGLDKQGRFLVAQSVPSAGMKVSGQKLSAVLRQLVGPYYGTITFSNARDRVLRRGRGRKAKAGTEPEITRQDLNAANQRIEAGTTISEAISRILRPLQLLSWGSADGKEFIVASPNYKQEPQYELFETLRGSNVLSMAVSKSNGGRYALIEVSGSGRAPGVPREFWEPSYPGEKRPKHVSQNRIGIAKDGPNRDGTGGDFKFPKRLFVVSEALSMQDAQVEAERILARGKIHALQVEVEAPGHGQFLQGASEPTLYAPDTVASVYKEIETSGTDRTPYVYVDQRMYVTRVTYRADRQTGETTRISLIPLESLLL